MYYATRRQKFLLDQGYSFQIKKNLLTSERLKDVKLYKTHEEQKYLLSIIEEEISRSKKEGRSMGEANLENTITTNNQNNTSTSVTRSVTTSVYLL